MAQRRVRLDEIGEVLLTKRRGARGLRLSVNVNGEVRVSLPHWVPYNTALKFAQRRRDWIINHQQRNRQVALSDGDKIGKTYTLRIKQLESSAVLTSRVSRGQITVTSSFTSDGQSVQQEAVKACERALRSEAKAILPARLSKIANARGFSYKTLRVRKLTSRWGSCSANKTITLSYFLVQLPWEFIDYVICHELVHTKYLNHSLNFWQTLESLVPGAKAMRKQMNAHKPRLTPNPDKELVA